MDEMNREDDRTSPPTHDTHAWLAEHERALDRMRSRINELEVAVEVQRESMVVHALAAAGIFSLLIAMSLPWLVHGRNGETASGWSLLLAPMDAPLTASAAYLTVAAIVIHVLALATHGRVMAIIGSVVAGLAGLAMVGLVFSVAKEPDVDVGPGPGVSLIILIVLGVTWGNIAESRRWH